ncbi:MAG: SDR family oxidoreductase [Balneolaceae bacterium]
MKRIDFLKNSGIVLAGSLINPIKVVEKKSTTWNPPKVLILGGRGFLGPSIVNQFNEAGYDITLLNRGITNPHLFPELPVIICDRELEDKKGLLAVESKIKAEYWDIVIDTWQKSPKAVSDFIEEFKNEIGHYHYISTISVYDKWDTKFIVEEEPLNPLPSFPSTIAEEHRYAIRKTFAEVAIMNKLDKYTIYRSHGMKDERITRPEDPNAEPFWPVRFYRGGDIILPEVPDHHMQVTDIKSLTRFIQTCAESNTYGAFNVAYHSTPFKDYISSLVLATESSKTLHWIDGDFLKSNGLIPYQIVPLWRERPVGAYYFNVQKAVKSGLVNRPITEMVADQIKGYTSRHPKDDVRFGEVTNGTLIKYYSMKKEKEILKNWSNE